ncbi:hypothetical protein [Adhaeretor mobilis]|nr:hypothetical protein [Adhaeretor mobilis]
MLVLVAILVVTAYAWLSRSIFSVGPQRIFDPWFQAKITDAYFDFLTFYIWVAHKERALGSVNYTG